MLLGVILILGGLQIAVNDAFIMRGFERLRNLPRDVQRVRDRDDTATKPRPARDSLRECLAFHSSRIKARAVSPESGEGSMD